MIEKSIGRIPPKVFTYVVGLVFLILGNSLFVYSVKAQDPFNHNLFLPIIVKPPCLLNVQEQELGLLLEQDPDQQRASLVCHPILAQVARQRAFDMAERHYFSHTTPEGYGPNYLVRQAGYVLPSYYSTALDANNIESIAAGNSTASDTWQQWMSSTPHRTHLLGLDPFFAEQVEYGIGYASDPDSPYHYYWVVITAKPGP